MEDASTTEQTPIDGERTEPQRAKKGSINWKAVKRRYMEGDGVSQIAKAFGISHSAIYSRIDRYDWPKRKEVLKAPSVPQLQRQRPAGDIANATQQAVCNVVTSELPAIQGKVREQIGKWFDKATRAANLLVDHVEDKANGPLEVEEIKSLSSSLSSLHGTMRQVFGLDGEGGARASMMISASSVTRVDCPIVEADVVAETPTQTQLQ